MNITSFLCAPSFNFKTVYFCLFERISKFFDITRWGKTCLGGFIVRENYSSEKINRRGKFSSEKIIRHLTKILSLFPDEVFPDKVV